MEWILLAHGEDEWRALVTTATNVPSLQITGNSLTSWATISFSRRTLFHEAGHSSVDSSTRLSVYRRCSVKWKDELERIWQEAVATQSCYCTTSCMEKLRKTTNNFIQKSPTNILTVRSLKFRRRVCRIERPTFRRITSACFFVGFLLDLLFNHEDGGEMYVVTTQNSAISISHPVRTSLRQTLWAVLVASPRKQKGSVSRSQPTRPQ